MALVSRTAWPGWDAGREVCLVLVNAVLASIRCSLPICPALIARPRPLLAGPAPVAPDMPRLSLLTLEAFTRDGTTPPG